MLNMGLGPSRINMTGPQAQLVKQVIASDQVVIFSKSFCPYCIMAKDIFEKMNTRYTCIELDHREDADEIQDVLGELTGTRTVPRVFVKGECIGGGSDVKRLYETGSLEDILRD